MFFVVGTNHVEERIRETSSGGCVDDSRRSVVIAEGQRLAGHAKGRTSW